MNKHISVKRRPNGHFLPKKIKTNSKIGSFLANQHFGIVRASRLGPTLSTPNNVSLRVHSLPAELFRVAGKHLLYVCDRCFFSDEER